MKDSQKNRWKKLWKKGLVFSMIGVMALGMVACGGKKKEADTKDTNTQKEQQADDAMKKENVPQKEEKNAEDAAKQDDKNKKDAMKDTAKENEKEMKKDTKKDDKKEDSSKQKAKEKDAAMKDKEKK